MFDALIWASLAIYSFVFFFGATLLLLQLTHTKEELREPLVWTSTGRVFKECVVEPWKRLLKRDFRGLSKK